MRRNGTSAASSHEAAAHPGLLLAPSLTLSVSPRDPSSLWTEHAHPHLPGNASTLRLAIPRTALGDAFRARRDTVAGSRDGLPLGFSIGLLVAGAAVTVGAVLAPMASSWLATAPGPAR